MPNNIQNILDCLEILGQQNVVPPELDYNDPMLYYRNPDSPSLIEIIPNLINTIPNFEGSSDRI